MIRCFPGRARRRAVVRSDITFAVIVRVLPMSFVLFGLFGRLCLISPSTIAILIRIRSRFVPNVSTSTGAGLAPPSIATRITGDRRLAVLLIRTAVLDIRRTRLIVLLSLRTPLRTRPFALLSIKDCARARSRTRPFELLCSHTLPFALLRLRTLPFALLCLRTCLFALNAQGDGLTQSTHGRRTEL